MRMVRRVVLAAAALAALLGLAGWVWLRATVPGMTGRDGLAGLDAPVRVTFDSLGIPAVTASSQTDLLQALGYLHARDRFFQMDLLRRAAEGRLAELVGARAVPLDQEAREWEMGRIARRAWAATPAADRQLIEAYARGVNAWLSTHPASLEHRLLRLPAERWSGADSYAILLLEAKQLHNQGDERIRAAALSRFGPGADTLLAPPYPDSAATVLDWPAGSVPPSAGGPARGAAEAGYWANAEPARGSNSWVVSGRRTASGRPILANDPHLPLTAPSIWYLAVLHAPGVDAEGATIPGVPGIVIGRNRAIAWGMTASYVDDVDEVPERFSPDTSRVRRKAGWEPVAVVAETIAVKGERARIYRRRRTSNGPVIRWTGDSEVRGIARRWTGQDAIAAGFIAVLGLMRARDWGSFRAAVGELAAPSLGMTYADTAGHIGYQLTGEVPVRADAGGGAAAPGWLTEGAWRGTVPFDSIPSALDPAPFIVTSNDRIVGRSYPYFLSSAWASPYRAERITELLAADSPATVRSLAGIQMDVQSRFAASARGVAARAAQALGQAAVASGLEQWDGGMRTGDSTPTLFWAWYRGVERHMAQVPGAAPATWAARHAWILSGVMRRAGGPPVPLDSLSEAAMREVLADPSSRLPWGRAHQLIQRHPLGGIPVLGRLLRLNLGPVPAEGGDYTVNLCTSGGERIPYQCTEGPSLRFIADMASDTGYFVLPAGQSGNPMSRHYRDLYPLWRDGRLVPLALDARPDSSRSALLLEPLGRH